MKKNRNRRKAKKRPLKKLGVVVDDRTYIPSYFSVRQARGHFLCARDGTVNFNRSIESSDGQYRY